MPVGFISVHTFCGAVFHVCVVCCCVHADCCGINAAMLQTVSAICSGALNIVCASENVLMCGIGNFTTYVVSINRAI